MINTTQISIFSDKVLIKTILGTELFCRQKINEMSSYNNYDLVVLERSEEYRNKILRPLLLK